MLSNPLHICLVAGEASGDFLGSLLMKALKRRAGQPVRFSGVGGPLMQAQGLDSLFPMETLSVMGITEVLPRLPDILARIRQTAAHVRDAKPDVLVTIDSPDFSFRVARKVKALTPALSQREREGPAQREGEGMQRPLMIHYVAPTVWAWRPERAAKVAKLYDGILCLFPFEPPYFEKEGMKAAFIGHPILESGLEQGYGDACRRRLEVPDGVHLGGLFFGSRRGELKRMGPVLCAAAAILRRKHTDLHFLVPTLPHLKDEVTAMLRGLPFPWKVVADPAGKEDLFAALDVALATSGTVGLELAVAGVPHVIGYKANALTAAIVKRKVTVKYAHLANILLDRPVVPEFIQEKCTAGAMAAAAEMLLNNETAQQDQLMAFKQVKAMLAGSSGALPSEQAADFILAAMPASDSYSRSLTGT
jgi:lipid-A-disaccharide synthase